MFKLISGLTKAAVGVVVDVPLSIAADMVTGLGTATDKDKPYTAEALGRVVENVGNAVNPEAGEE